MALASCATNYPQLNSSILISPIRDASMSEIASITLSARRGLREEMRFLRLDGDPSKRFESNQGIFQVPPGSREIKIQYGAIEFGRLIRQAICTLEIDREPGKRYLPYAEGRENGSKCG